MSCGNLYCTSLFSAQRDCYSVNTCACILLNVTCLEWFARYNVVNVLGCTDQSYKAVDPVTRAIYSHASMECALVFFVLPIVRCIRRLCKHADAVHACTPTPSVREAWSYDDHKNYTNDTAVLACLDFERAGIGRLVGNLSFGCERTR